MPLLFIIKNTDLKRKIRHLSSDDDNILIGGGDGINFFLKRIRNIPGTFVQSYRGFAPGEDVKAPYRHRLA